MNRVYWGLVLPLQSGPLSWVPIEGCFTSSVRAPLMGPYGGLVLPLQSGPLLWVPIEGLFYLFSQGPSHGSLWRACFTSSVRAPLVGPYWELVLPLQSGPLLWVPIEGCFTSSVRASPMSLYWGLSFNLFLSWFGTWRPIYTQTRNPCTKTHRSVATWRTLSSESPTLCLGHPWISTRGSSISSTKLQPSQAPSGQACLLYKCFIK